MTKRHWSACRSVGRKAPRMATNNTQTAASKGCQSACTTRRVAGRTGQVELHG
jgi:hypothetical protein